MFPLFPPFPVECSVWGFNLHWSLKLWSWRRHEVSIGENHRVFQWEAIWWRLNSWGLLFRSNGGFLQLIRDVKLAMTDPMLPCSTHFCLGCRSPRDEKFNEDISWCWVQNRGNFPQHFKILNFSCCIAIFWFTFHISKVELKIHWVFVITTFLFNLGKTPKTRGEFFFENFGEAEDLGDRFRDVSTDVMDLPRTCWRLKVQILWMIVSPGVWLVCVTQTFFETNETTVESVF